MYMDAKDPKKPRRRDVVEAEFDILLEKNKAARLNLDSRPFGGDVLGVYDDLDESGRSYRDLLARTQQMKGDTSMAVVGNSLSDGAKILSKKGFDSQNLKDSIDKFEPKTVQRRGHSKNVTDIDGFINGTVDNLLWSQIYDSTGRTSGSFIEVIVNDTHSQWAAEEWSDSQTKFMDSLGHRNQKWKNKQNQMVTSALGYRQEQSFAAQPAIMQYGQQYAAGGDGSGMNGGAGAAANSQAMVALPPIPHGLPMSDFAKKHAEVVRRVAKAQQGFGGQDAPSLVPPRPAKAFVDLIMQTVASRTPTDADNLSRKDLEGYQDITQMLSSVVGEYKRVPPSPGAFSSICFELAPASDPNLLMPEDRNAIQTHARSLRRTHLELTIGGKLHLENQMKELWSEFVDSAVQRNRTTLHPLVAGEAESSRQKVRAYVRMRDQMRSGGHIGQDYQQPGIRSPRDNGATPVWSFVYHCLRVGDLEGAGVELSICRDEGFQVEVEIITVLGLFQKVLESVKNTNQANKEAPPNLLSTLEANDLKRSLNACRQLYCDEDNKISDAEARGNRPCLYRLFILNLLSLADVDLFSQSPDEAAVPEIEHYLWGELWYIQWNGILKLCGFETISDNSSDNGESSLYDSILGYGGEEYFEEGSDPSDPNHEPLDPFVYARVLICCQRYGDAINYLWRKDKVFPAIHLTVVCLHYGLILPYRPLTENPPYKGAIAGAAASSYGNPEPASIIRVYTSAPFMLDYPEETVDYLMCLNSLWKEGLNGGGIKDRINPDGLFWEAETIKSEARLTQEFTHLLTSLDRAQLVKLVGDVRVDTASMAANQDLDYMVNDANAGNLASRTRGYLDSHITNADIVDNLLARAAYYLLTTVRDAEGAIHLYQLAGRYADVMQEMITQLCTVLVPPHSHRDFWRKAAIAFSDTFLRAGLGPVVLVLQVSLTLNVSILVVSCVLDSSDVL